MPASRIKSGMWERREGRQMSFDVRANANNIQVYEASEYLQNIDNLVYLLQFKCASCFAKNTLIFDRHCIDNELEDKQNYTREENL